MSPALSTKIKLFGVLALLVGVIAGVQLVSNVTDIRNRAQTGPVCQPVKGRCDIDLDPNMQYHTYRIQVIDNKGNLVVPTSEGSDFVEFDANPEAEYTCRVIPITAGGAFDRSSGCTVESVTGNAPLCIQLTPIPSITTPTASPTLTPTPTPPCPDCVPPKVMPAPGVSLGTPSCDNSCDFDIILDPDACYRENEVMRIRLKNDGCLTCDVNGSPITKCGKTGAILTCPGRPSGLTDIKLVCDSLGSPVTPSGNGDGDIIDSGTPKDYACHKQLPVVCEGPTPTKIPVTPTDEPGITITPELTDIPVNRSCPNFDSSEELTLEPVPMLPGDPILRACRKSQRWVCSVPSDILQKLGNTPYRLEIHSNGDVISRGPDNTASYEFEADSGRDYTCKLVTIGESGNIEDICLEITGRQECEIINNIGDIVVPSPTPHVQVKTSNTCNKIADLNNDGRVNLTDFELFRQAYSGAASIDADLNCDNSTDLTDWVRFSAQFFSR